MIIKYIIYLLSIILILITVSTIRYIYWNHLLHRRQSVLGSNLRTKLGYKWRFTIMITLIISIITIRMNATDIYVSVFVGSTSADCAYALNDNETVLEYNPDVFIATIHSLDKIKQYDIYNDNHDTLVDRYFYKFESLEILRGMTENSAILNVSIPIEHPYINRTDFCRDVTKLELGETYLIIGGYLSPTEAKQNTDPRIKEGDWYYATKIVFLENYDGDKPLNQQTKEIQTVIKEYQDLINQSN